MKSRGFTLIEFMIVLAIVCILLLVVLGKGCTSIVTAPTIQSNATGYARDYARRFHRWSSPTIACAGEDSNHDGYVTCTIAQAPGTPTEQIRCPSNFVLEGNTTCHTVNVRNMQWGGNGDQ